jgi:beta-glucosidase
LEERGTVQLVAHKSHSIYVEFCNVRGPADGDEDEIVMDMTAGVRLGGAELQDPEERLESAVELAKDVDAVIAVVGLNADWYENPQLVNGIVLF